MSKKTRKKTLKKSSKTTAGNTARARSATSTKKPAAKKRAMPARQPASKSASGASKRPKTVTDKAATNKTVTRKTATKSAAPKASHQGASKPLKSQVPADAGRPKSTLGTMTPESGATAAAKPKILALKIAKTATEKTGTEKTTTAKPLPETIDAPTGGHIALAEGMKAPGFRLPRDGGDTVSLADFAGRKLVLFFYPRADTPGCTKEAIDFTRLAGAFAESQTAVLGVSADPPKAQEAFRDKHELTVPLVSDETHAMLEAYGVWGEKSMYGRTFLGILRTTVLIGADGRIARIWRHVKVDGHADEVLATAKAA
jgi:thioredoxin-dependent peroxiredoxin